MLFQVRPGAAGLDSESLALSPKRVKQPELRPLRLVRMAYNKKVIIVLITLLMVYIIDVF